MISTLDPRRKSLRAACRQRGFSLVELMIAMVAGLLAVLVVVQALLANRTTSNTQNDISRIQESNRFAFDLMSTHIRLAGFHSSDTWSNFNPASGTSCAASILHPICGNNDGGTNSSDELQIRFYGMDNPAATGAEGGIVDCSGTAVPATTTTGGVTTQVEVEERFRVEMSNNIPTLVCYVLTGSTAIAGAPAPPAVSTGTRVELLPGVERIQFLYGFDTNNDGQVDQWLPANPANDMQRVLAVKVSMLIRGDSVNGATSLDSATYDFFGPDYPRTGDAGARLSNPNDYRVRKLVGFTTSLRNRM
ncbi:MAG: prepilin-type N-terminal cleavage/methylation domain-containing protein [Zoogloea sp.]|nr:prepilin-type N-terminal cleavage/methylation domain-containing protein [Zoogloea sp.]